MAEGDNRGSRSKVRAFVTLGITAVATAAIGFGGLAAWSVTTQNNGSSLNSGTVHHSNKATSNISVVKATSPGSIVATCTDVTSPGACGVVFNVTAAKPGAVVTGSVQITNTGSLQSTFTFAQPSAPVVAPGGNTLCNDLTLSVVDNEAAPVTVYAGTLNAVIAPVQVRTSAGALAWNTADTATYTFTLTLSNAAALTSMGGVCTAGFTFAQTNT